MISYLDFFNFSWHFESEFQVFEVKFTFLEADAMRKNGKWTLDGFVYFQLTTDI